MEKCSASVIKSFKINDFIVCSSNSELISILLVTKDYTCDKVNLKTQVLLQMSRILDQNKS